jgi:hypothetical protein
VSGGGQARLPRIGFEPMVSALRGLMWETPVCSDWYGRHVLPMPRCRVSRSLPSVDGARESVAAVGATAHRGNRSVSARCLPGCHRGACQRRSGCPDAISNVEESLRRADFMFYSAKRWDEGHYLAEVTRLTAVRDELAAQATPQKPPLDFTGILSAWDSGEPGTRRDLLASLFDALNVEDGVIVACVPRADRAADVTTLFAVCDECGGCGGRDSPPHSPPWRCCSREGRLSREAIAGHGRPDRAHQQRGPDRG